MLITPFIHLIYGILWLFWLNALRVPSQSQSTFKDKKCSSVKPCLSTFLYIIAWVQVVASVIMIGFLCASPHMHNFPLTPYLICMLVVFIAIFVLQILYIRDLRNSERTLSEDCTTKQNRVYRYIIYGISVFFIITGILGIVGLFTSLSSSTPHRYTEKDIASLLQKPELLQAVSQLPKQPNKHKHHHHKKSK